MSAFSESVQANVQSVLNIAWDITDGQVVPETDDVTLKNGGRRLHATYLYADMGGSSTAAQRLKKEATAKLIRSYLDAATRIIRHFEGYIRSFDGDRVMGVYIGGSKNSNAVRTALAINWAVDEVLRPKFKTKWPSTEDTYIVHHGIGVHTGEALMVRAGVRNNNDLISIGDAPNVAAKLSELRGKPDLYITTSVFNNMNDEVKLSKPDKKPIWNDFASQTIGGKTFAVKGSTWWRRP